MLNEQVKRNIERFPEVFCFQLDKNEFENRKSPIVTSISNAVDQNLKSQNETSKNETRGERQYFPYAFTEQGVAMLSSVFEK